MTILGLSLSPHDSSAAIVENGKVSIAIEEERLSHVRHCIKYDNSQYNLKSEAKYFDSNFLNPSIDSLRKKINRFYKYFKQGNKHIEEQVSMIVGSNLTGTNVPVDNYININHHLAHAAHAFYTSPYTEAAVLVIDGAGDYFDDSFETVSLYSAHGGSLHLLEKVTGQINHSTNTIIALSNSVGVLYQNTASLCGFGPFGEGKLMGIASYGKPRYVKKFSKYCVKKDTYYQIDNIGLYRCIAKTVNRDTGQKNIADVASSVQKIINNVVLFYARRIKEVTGHRNLCYAGGVALNAIANTKILEKSGFKRVYIPSAPGDNGVSIGAALYGHYQINGNQKKISSGVPPVYLGYKYNDKVLTQAINKYRKYINFEKLRYNKIPPKIAKLLADDNVVAWFQGASEFGPRALGHRSILASPLKMSTRVRLNKIKSRESFRPVAPMMTIDDLSDYFYCPPKVVADSLPYMLFAYTPLNKRITKKIPAAVHVDNTSRLQVLSKNQNSRLYVLLKEFAKISETPILINTSFNIKGEPMVETPKDAIKIFIKSNIDYLVLNNYLIKRL
ncbi:MAG: hypothetical protein A3E36_00610 [Candidatus Andersenbacteria bacterium RIFCSPHIGHO2_12_FULL_45_11b]|uniref:Carbamoyltransferase n=1 Tax=Candidatus Andersenbacteria bacterium RIFCSPHIGHO2_12_FULL_45_11b TaxID=1797282 RepID=A0A1G1X566_9BACT|nr:MAG: hypothetical protein A3E36_00610 [Candidatus Andersenbacteria bacterium RIFCSPHIGHO2_12_FULL_45_11b]